MQASLDVHTSREASSSSNAGLFYVYPPVGECSPVMACQTKPGGARAGEAKVFTPPNTQVSRTQRTA